MARHRVPIAAAVVCGVLVTAGCGSASKPSSVSTSATTSRSVSRSATTSSSAGASVAGSRRAGKRSPPAYARSQLDAAACIRSHGVPNFPDPTFGAGGIQVNLTTPAGMLTSPGFFLAEKECAKLGLVLAGYAPVSTATAAEMSQALTIARCMRAHGVPNWPDPRKTLPSNLNGYGVQSAVPGPPGGPVFVIPNSIDVESPAVKQAATLCHDA
jgi:outer membrane murein-binding lipoprotein Lpp